jgi:RNAse (barnase) inhibitor barstar
MNPPRETATALDALPAQTVRRLGNWDVDALRRAAGERGLRFVFGDCSACIDKESVLQAIGRAFEFPAWYGANLDALYDCLTDLPDRGAPGWVVVIAGLPRTPGFDAADQAALLDVFRDAAEDFAGRGLSLRVFFS